MNALADDPDYSMQPPDEQAAHYSEQLEQAILGCVMLWPETFPRVKALIQPDDFYFHEHRKIYTTMLSLVDDEILPDQGAVGERMSKMRASTPEYVTLLQEVGGRLGLCNICEQHCRPELIDNNLCQVWNYGALRKTQKELTITQRALNTDNPNVIDIRSRLVSRLHEIGNRTDDQPSRVGDLSMGVFNELELRASGEQPVGLKVRFGGIDAITQGFDPGSLILIAARPSVGKTMLAFNMLHNVAKHFGKTAAFFSCEMPNKIVYERMLANEARVPAEDLRSGKLAAHWKNITEALGRIADFKLFIFDNQHHINTVDGIDARLQQLKSQGQLPDIIAIDYVQIMMSSRFTSGNRNLEIGELSIGCKRLALKYGIPVILLSQLSRAIRERMDKRPALTDLRDSGSLEQDADLVMFIHRDEYYNHDSEDKGLAEIIIAKNRNGRLGTVVLEYHPEYQFFSDSDLNPNELKSRQQPVKEPKSKRRGYGNGRNYHEPNEGE